MDITKKLTFDFTTEAIYNWSGVKLLAYKEQLFLPNSEKDILDLIINTENLKLRMIGSGLSYESLNKLDESSEHNHILLSLENYHGFISETEDTITFRAGSTLNDLFTHLSKQNKMLTQCIGVIGIQTLAGAIGTGTHGQGMQQGTLCDALSKLKIITAKGEIKIVDRNDPDFGAFIMHYGSLGIVVEVTFYTVPMEYYTCHRIDKNFDEFCNIFEDINEQSQYVKAWWFPDSDIVHIWEVNKADNDEANQYIQNNKELTSISFDANNKNLNKTIDNLIIKMANETNDVIQEGRQFETINRFKNSSSIVVGDIYQIFCKGIPCRQINCEIAVKFEFLKEALQALHDWFQQSDHKPHYPFILRCTGPSEAYLSGAYGRKVCWIGFLVYLAKDGAFIEGSQEMMRELQLILSKFEGVPHIGKHFIKEIFDFNINLPRWNDFLKIRNDIDPKGIFQNQFLENMFK